MELKPCPFCGDEAELKEWEQELAFSEELNTFCVCCSKCGCAPFPKSVVNLYYKHDCHEIAEQLKNKAVSAWNCRSTSNEEVVSKIGPQT